MDKPLLDLYAGYLISSFGPTTATGLSRLLQAHLSHDKITRFLSEKPYTSANLWQIVKPLVRQVQNEDAVLVVDDSITKYSDERHGGWFATDRRTARFFGPRIGTTKYYIYSIICSFVSEPSQRSVKLRLMPDKANPDTPSLMGYMPPKMHESTVRDSLTVLRAFGLIATTCITGNRGETVYELLDSRRAKAALLAKEAQRNIACGLCLADET